MADRQTFIPFQYSVVPQGAYDNYTHPKTRLYSFSQDQRRYIEIISSTPYHVLVQGESFMKYSKEMFWVYERPTCAEKTLTSDHGCRRAAHL